MCYLFSRWTYLCWENTNNEHINLPLRDILMQVGIKRLEFETNLKQYDNPKKCEMGAKIKEIKKRSYITISKKPKLQSDLF